MPTAFQRFDQAIQSQYTRPAYHKYFKEFLEYGHKSSDELVIMDFKEIDSLIFDYIVHQKMRTEKGEISPNSFNVIFSPIQLFLEQNDIMINWKKLKRMFPRKKDPSNQAPYTNKDIQKMLNGTTSLRNIAFVHFMASTACRIGAIHTLKVEDIEPIEDGAIVTVYRGDIEEYRTCLTPEAFTAINDYFEFRNMMGYPVRPESPLLCDKSNSKGITYSNSKDLIRNILNTSGLKRTVKGRTTKNGKSQNHAFRKRFETILVNANIHSKYIGFMMGHFEKQDRYYFKPTNEELYQNFKKAVPSLVIDDSIRLLEENKIKGQKIKEFEKKDERIDKLESQMAQINMLLNEAKKSK